MNTQKEKLMVVGFKNKAKNFWGIWNDLDKKRNSVAVQKSGIKKDYIELMDRGESIKNTIVTITKTIDNVVRIYGGFKRWLSTGNRDGNVKGLGVVFPLIPIATIVVSVAAMSKWVKDAYILNKRVNSVQKFIDQGINPVEAGKLVNYKTPGVVLNTLLKGVIPLTLLIAGFIILNKRQ